MADTQKIKPSDIVKLLGGLEIREAKQILADAIEYLGQVIIPVAEEGSNQSSQ